MEKTQAAMADRNGDVGAVQEEQNKSPTDQVPRRFFGVRHVQAVLLFLCFFIAFFLRINLSVGIVAMTNRNSSNPDFEELDWDEPTKSKVLSSFFWGYLVMQIPAGQLGQQFSPKRLLLATNTICALLTLLIPFAAVRSWVLVCAIRVGLGLSQGFYVPLSYNLASKWVPPNERNRFVGYFLNGGTLGATVGLPLSGLLASSIGGWPSIFYFSGMLGLIWVGLWAWFGADSPAKHTNISDRERHYIQDALNQTNETKVYATPWQAIFTSIPMWALICAHLGNGWGFGMVITEMPSYIHSVLGFDIAANGVLSAVPYLTMWLVTFPMCWIADVINKRNILTATISRKMWTTISQTGSAIMLLLLGYVGHDAVTAMVLLTITVSLSSCIFMGFIINHLDLGPNFAGVLMGIGNGLENITTILAPLTVGWIVTDTTSLEQWRLVFFITAGASMLGNLIFVLFGSAQVQPWNEPKLEELESKRDKDDKMNTSHMHRNA